MSVTYRARRARRVMSEINAVPYIDVVLVLLVIFMITAPLVLQGIEVDLPGAPSEPLEGEDEDPLVVSMRADGSIFVNLGLADETRAANRVTVYSLEEQVGKLLRARPALPVFVRADASIEYGEVVRVMTILQKAGAISVGLVTEAPGSGAMRDDDTS